MYDGDSGFRYDGFCKILGIFHLNRKTTCFVVENKWSVGPTMTFCRANVAVALVNERLWAVGGFNGKDFLRSVEFLDENSEEWTNILTIGENKSESNENLVKESEEEVAAVSEETDDLPPQDTRYLFTEMLI